MSVPSFNAVAPDKLAVVTGAAGGIGLAPARAFADAGMRVVLVDRPGEALQAAAATITGATALSADVADRAAMAELAWTVAERHGPVSVLMNNAGVGLGGDVYADPVAWAEVLGVNLFGVHNGVRAFVPALIVNTGSKQGVTQPPVNTAYNVSTAGVKALTEGLAHSLRERTGDRSARTSHSRLHLYRHDRAYREAANGMDPGTGCHSGHRKKRSPFLLNE